MDRTIRRYAAELALGCGLAFAGGCGPHEAGPAATAPDAEQAVQRQIAPPRHFVADRARPMPLPLAVTAHKVAIPVQAQFAQPTTPAPGTPGNSSVYEPVQADQRRDQASISRIPPVTAENAPPATSHVLGHAPDVQQIANQVETLNRRAAGMAHKGMLFAAKDELMRALELAAQSLDAHRGIPAHAEALAAGLTALREAEDFSRAPRSRDSSTPNASQIAHGHRTAILPAGSALSPFAAQQRYFAFAQQQLASAVTGQPAASRSLYLLGKIQLALPDSTSSESAPPPSMAMVWFQAALAADSRNHLAANELGVLLARGGQLDAARQALQHSISVEPQVETWHNLAVVHQRLGEAELARLAENERRLLAEQVPRGVPANKQQIAWVDAGTFAAPAAKEDGPLLSTASQPAPTTRR